MKIGKFILTGISIMVFYGIYLYEPIKENHSYTREIELNEFIYNDEYLPEEELAQLSKENCTKIVGIDESEILYFEGQIIAENYNSTIILKESYQSIVIVLNPYSGELIYYYKSY